MQWVRAAAVAERLWSPKVPVPVPEAPKKDMERRMNLFRCHLIARDINVRFGDACRHPSPAPPWQHPSRLLFVAQTPGVSISEVSKPLEGYELLAECARLPSRTLALEDTTEQHADSRRTFLRWTVSDTIAHTS